MKIAISREILLPALQAVNNVVERRQALPILSNVLLQAGEEHLQLTATDMEVELVCEVENSAVETGSVALPARKMLDICRALPSDATIRIEVVEERARVASGRSRFTLTSMNAREFPGIGGFEAETDLELPTEVLAELMESTHFAMAHQDVRYYLNGLLLEIGDNRIRAVATDGHRLALTDRPLAEEVQSKRQVIIPRKGVLEIVRLLNAAGEQVRLRIGENHAQVATDRQSLTTKLVDGRFPDYEGVIPEESANALVADREALRAGLSRASILSNEKFRGIRLSLKENMLVAVAHNPEQEEAEEEIEVEYTGDVMEVGFNVSYLLDVLGVVRAEKVRMDLVDADSSCLIRELEDTGSRYVVMPMRL